jgi:hypothetical protein
MQATWARKRGDRLVGLREEDPSPTEIVRPLGRTENVVASMPGEPQFKAYPDPELTEFAIGNNRKVRRRGSLLCRAVAHGSLAATLLWALPVQAADDVTDLLVQVKKQLEQSQRQMEQSHRQMEQSQRQMEQSQRQMEQSQRQLEQSQREVKALKRQVELLTKRVDRTPVVPARGVAPAPDAKDIVVMQQPGNLPGRKQQQAPAATGPLSKGQSPQPVLHDPMHDLVAASGLLQAGEFPGSFMIPGTNTSIGFHGYAKLESSMI